MLIFWWAMGVLLAALWVWRAADAGLGMRKVAEISQPAWDKKPPLHPPRISIIVPARDEEEEIESALRSLVTLDWPNYEVIAVNDRSTDRTGALMEHVAREHDAHHRLRVVHLDNLPSGWLGKPHAMSVGAKHATGDWLLFTDADVVFRHDALRRAMAYAISVNADHLVMFPTHIDWSVSKKIMLAGFNMLFVFGHRPWKTSDPKARDHMGVGAFNLVKKSVFDAIGGMEKLKMEIIEDMRMGKLIKDSGFLQYNVFGRDLLLLPWGAGAWALSSNLTKNFFALMHFSVARALGMCFLIALFNLMPFVGFWFAPGLAKLGYVLSLFSVFCLYVGMSWYSPIWPFYFFFHPISAGLLIFTFLRSMLHTLRHNGVIWRGTHYSLAELRRGLVKG
ncbi:MAG TPA: glycosyltransferase family 2 protein [Terriglobales bacterium]|nr:glycosyltransferase family 2 protein [Terriglobales bacterium]